MPAAPVGPPSVEQSPSADAVEASGPGAWGGLRSGRVLGHAGAVLVIAACTAVAALMYGRFELSDLTMVYLLGVVVTAVAFGRGPAIAAALLAVAAFNFGFVPPRFTFHVAEDQYLVTFAVMLVVAVVTGTLTARLREQLVEAKYRERRTASLYRLSREVGLAGAADEVLQVAAKRIADTLSARIAILGPEPPDGMRVLAGDGDLASSEERAAARRAYENGQIAGLRHARNGSHVLHVPLEAGLRSYGVLSARPAAGDWDGERLHLLRMLASQTALALERCRLAEEANAARAQVATERARSALLSSVSHDLRTPLAAITGAATGLRDGSAPLAEAARRELADTIAEEAQRLNRMIGNILDMTRLESGTLRVRREWHSLEEVVGAALVRLEGLLGDRPVQLVIPADLPLVSLDDVLFEQLVCNLVENAHKYAPAGRPIELSAAIEGDRLRFEVADRGPGLGPGEESRVFEKFYRGAAATAQPGVGLGLAICHGIVAAHGGTIAAANRAGGGAVFTVLLPLAGTPPTVEAETEDDLAAPGER